MTELRNLTVAHLRQIVSIKEQIESLKAELDVMTRETSAPSPKAHVDNRGKYKRSAKVRAAMAAAQKARWAKLTERTTAAVATDAPPKKRKMSAAAKAKISTAAKARWAKAKAEGKKGL